MANRRTQQEAFEYIRNAPHIKKVRQGDYKPGAWFYAEPGDGSDLWHAWGLKAQPSKRGLTLLDTNRVDPSPEPPEEAPSRPIIRGSGVDGGLPLTEYPVSKRHQVWSDNVVSLYEEATSRQWSATRDIPWDKLTPLPRDQEKAFCQIVSHLSRVEYLAADVVGAWLPQIATAYFETKLFLSTQAMDEARHTEVFRKRALANGGGIAPSFSNANPEHHERTRRQLSRYQDASFLLFLAEGFGLDLFRFSEFLGKTETDKAIFQRVMQDEARHVSYHTMRLAYDLANNPDVEAELDYLHNLCDRVEPDLFVWDFLNPHFMEAGAILAAGSLDRIDRGYDAIRMLYLRIRDEYLKRCERAGFQRRGRCTIPPDPPF